MTITIYSKLGSELKLDFEAGERNPVERRQKEILVTIGDTFKIKDLLESL